MAIMQAEFDAVKAAPRHSLLQQHHFSRGYQLKGLHTKHGNGSVRVLRPKCLLSACEAGRVSQLSLLQARSPNGLQDGSLNLLSCCRLQGPLTPPRNPSQPVTPRTFLHFQLPHVLVYQESRQPPSFARSYAGDTCLSQHTWPRCIDLVGCSGAGWLFRCCQPCT